MTGAVRTSWYPQDDAGWLTAVTIAGAGGTVILDSDMVFTLSYAGGAGQAMVVEGGSIAPPASSASFSWLGTIAAPMTPVFIGANKSQVRLSANQPIIYPQWWGAVGDGATDDYAAIMATFAACPPNGGTTVKLTAVFGTASTIVLGDGSSSARSSINGIAIEGFHSPGASAGDVSYAIVTGFRWVGASSLSNIVMQFDGPMWGPSRRNFIVDCNQAAGVGIIDNHFLRAVTDGVLVDNALPGGDQFAWQMATRSGVSAIGFTQGMFYNRYSNCGVKYLHAGNGNCMSLSGDPAYGGGFSLNIFENINLTRGNTDTSISLQYNFIDNNNFDRLFTVSNAGSLGTGPNYTGIGIQRLTQTTGSAPNDFPKENRFFGANPVGATANVDEDTLLAASNGGYDIFVGYGVFDGEPISLPFWMRAVNDDGQLTNGFAGSAVIGSGIATAGLGASLLYFPALTAAAGDSSSGNEISMAPCAMTVKRLGAQIGAFPGTGASRTATFYVNGVATSLTCSWGATENGYQSSPTGAIAVSVSDYLEVQWTYSGVPASSKASWSVYYYPNDVL